MTDAEKIITLSAIIKDLDYLTTSHGLEPNLNRIKIGLKKDLRRELERIAPRLIVFRAWCSLRDEQDTKTKIDLLLKTIKL
mgnify:CR=1 FL=1